MNRYFTMIDGRYSRGFITIYEENGYHRITVNHAPIGSYDKGTEDSYMAEITYPPTKVGWDAAWRIARQLSNATPGNPARLDDGDACCVYLVILGQELTEHVCDWYKTAPLRLMDREEAA